MDAFVYTQVCVLPVISVLILYFDSRKRLNPSANNKLLRINMLLICAILMAESFERLLAGNPGLHIKIFMWTVDYVYFTFMGLAPAIWLTYVCLRLHRVSTLSKKRMLAIFSPFCIYLVALILTPFTHAIFFIDSNNDYQRGSYIILQQLLCLMYLMLSSVMALLHLKKLKSRDRRRECILLSMFVVLPFLGGILQSSYYGVTLIWQLAASSMAMLYLNLQQDRAYVDELTGLKNRRKFDETLMLSSPVSTNIEDDDQMTLLPAVRRQPFYLIMFDVNDFKQINDTHGHLEGDRALRHAAKQLSSVFGKEDSLVARYGGDEFVVVLNTDKEERVIELLAELRERMKKPMPGSDNIAISLSSGYAAFSPENPVPIPQLIRDADAQMYIDKQQRKGGKA